MISGFRKKGPISGTRSRVLYQVKEYGVTEVTLFPVRGKVFLQQTSEC